MSNIVGGFTKEVGDICCLPPLTEPVSDEEMVLLKESIQEEGILLPLVVLKTNNYLIDGFKRLQIARQLGMREVPVVYVTGVFCADIAALRQLERFRLRIK